MKSSKWNISLELVLIRLIHPDFKSTYHLKSKVFLNCIRNCEIGHWKIPRWNELLHHTHALTSVYSTFLKLSDAS